MKRSRVASRIPVFFYERDQEPKNEKRKLRAENREIGEKGKSEKRGNRRKGEIGESENRRIGKKRKAKNRRISRGGKKTMETKPFHLAARLECFELILGEVGPHRDVVHHAAACGVQLQQNRVREGDADWEPSGVGSSRAGGVRG